jgi:hypothetical protein
LRTVDVGLILFRPVAGLQLEHRAIQCTGALFDLRHQFFSHGPDCAWVCFSISGMAIGAVQS